MQFGKASPLRLVGRNLGILDPVAAGILVKIDAGVNVLIDVVDTESRAGLGGRVRLRKAYRSHEQQKAQHDREPAHKKFSLEQRVRFYAGPFAKSNRRRDCRGSSPAYRI